MAKIEVDMNQKDVEGLANPVFDPLPDGEYEVSCSAVELVTSSKGTPMIKWTFDIINDPDYVGRKIWSNTVINEKKEDNFSLANHLDALGVAVDKNGSFESDEALGRTALAKITQGEYNGKITNNIKKLFRKE